MPVAACGRPCTRKGRPMRTRAPRMRLASPSRPGIWLAPLVLDILMPIAEKNVDVPVSLILNPAARPAVESLLEQATGLPITVVEEPSLSEGQVYLRLGTVETHINLDRAIAEITTAVRGFFETPERIKDHG